MRCPVDDFARACVDGARGNLTAAYAAAFEVYSGRTRRAVCDRLVSLADGCGRVDDGDMDSGSFVWLDGSRRRRFVVG